MVANSQTKNHHLSVEYLRNEAISKHKEGNATAAVGLYLKTIQTDSNQPDWVYGNLISLLGQLERFDQGLALAERALVIHGESASVQRSIGIVYENQGDSLNCIQRYQRAIALEPQQPDWLFCNLTKQLLATKQYDLAVKTGNQGVNLYGGFHPLHYALGNAYAAQAEWSKAIVCYQQVQRLNPNWLELGQKLNRAIYQQSKVNRLVDYQPDNQNTKIPIENLEKSDTSVKFDINSLFASLQKQQLYVGACRKLWQKITDNQQTLNHSCWLSPSILYLEITVDSNYLFTQTSVLACSEHKYAVANANFWQISQRQYAGIACFTTNVHLAEYESYQIALNDHNTLLIIAGEVSQTAYSLELVEHLKTKSDRQQNLIRESICRAVIKSISPQNIAQGKDLLHKLQYFLDIPYSNFVEPNLPFKIFIDNSIPLESEGLFISGWLHDPYQMLEKITAVSALGFSLELSHQELHRLTRQDVKAYLEDTRYSNFTEKLGFCGYLPVPETIQSSLQDLAELHSFRFVVSLKGNIEIEIAADIQHGDYFQARQELMQIARPQEVSEQMLTNCFAPVALKLQQLCMEQVQIKDVIMMGESTPHPLVSIIIPLYRRLDFLKVQLATLAIDPAIKQCELIYVLDSPEQEEELTTLLQQHSALYQLGIKLVVMNQNSGYAAANNAGADQATGKYIVLLNSDVFAHTKGWMLDMAKFSDRNPNIGTLGAKLVYEDNSLQHAGMFFAKTTFPFWITLHYHKGLSGSYSAAQQTKAVPTVTGACLMIRQELYAQVGGLTTDYIIGDFEDSDLCLKCQELGYESWYFADATLYHLERQSVPLNTVYSGSLAWQLNARLHHQRWEKQVSQLMKIHGDSR